MCAHMFKIAWTINYILFYLFGCTLYFHCFSVRLVATSLYCFVYLAIQLLGLQICYNNVESSWLKRYTVASLGEADRPGWHPPGGWHPKEKKLWANLQRIVEKRGRTGKKRSPGFSGKNKGVTPSVAVPGVTHPSDATAHNAVFSPVFLSLSFLFFSPPFLLFALSFPRLEVAPRIQLRNSGERC